MIFTTETTINPATHTTVKTINSFKIARITIDERCTIEVQSYDVNNHLVDINLLTLTPEEYAAWGTDDSYIVDLVASKLSFTKA
jgi:hypothetical protein